MERACVESGEITRPDQFVLTLFFEVDRECHVLERVVRHRDMGRGEAVGLNGEVCDFAFAKIVAQI